VGLFGRLFRRRYTVADLSAEQRGRLAELVEQWGPAVTAIATALLGAGLWPALLLAVLGALLHHFGRARFTLVSPMRSAADAEQSRAHARAELQRLADELTAVTEE
jgi:hypothetical protein